MSDLLNRLKDFLLDNKTTNIPEIKYLQESDITLTINRGFTELYRLKPENPILFLSKWLSRESRAKELEKKYKDNKIKRENLEIKYYQQEKQKYILQQRDFQAKKVRKDDEDSLIQEIKECKDFWLGFNHICERLKTLTKATGCYIGIYDQKRRAVKEDDDMDGHLDPSGTKVLRYIGWNNDHQFLDGECLEPNQGVTYDLITTKPAQEGNIENQNQENKNPDPNQQNVNEGEKKEEVVEKKLEDTVKTLLIEDVVNDNRIKFFKEPRLGCYLALDLTYKTSLSYNSLLSAIQCTKNYEASKEEQEARKKEWNEKQEEIKSQINELKEAKIKEEEAKKIAEEKALEAEAKAKLAAANENDPNKPQEEKKDNAPPQQQGNNSQGNINKKDNSIEHGESIEALEKQLTEWSEEPVKLQDYDKEEKNIYMCLDTLGQDRVFSKDEIKYIKIVGANIRDSLEKLEQSLLEKDRDIRIKFLNDEAKLKAEEKYSDEKYDEFASNYVSQFYSSEEYKSKGITDEDAKAFEGDLAKMKYLKNILLEGDCQNILLTFQDFEFVEYLKIFQNLFYFAKMNPLDINELKTNKLEWKRARKFWKDLFPYTKEYNPVGPKPEEIKSIYKLNKIKENLESCLTKRDEVKAYSQTLLMFIDLILHIIKVRHDNIIDRICKTAVYKDKREQIIKNNNEIDEERQKIIDAAKAQNPNVKIPGENENKEEVKEGEEEKKEGEENKQENKENENKDSPKENEKKEEGKEKKEEKKEDNKEKKEENKPESEQGENKEGEQKENEENNQDEIDSAKLAEDLQKFDEEHPKQEVPPDVEYDIDNDYDIDQAERDLVINNALQAANNAANSQDKKQPAAAPTTGANPQPSNPPPATKPNAPA